MSEQSKKKATLALIVGGRGAIGLLHASFLNSYIHEHSDISSTTRTGDTTSSSNNNVNLCRSCNISVALLGRPNLQSNRFTKPCGYIPYNDGDNSSKGCHHDTDEEEVIALSEPFVKYVTSEDVRQFFCLEEETCIKPKRMSHDGEQCDYEKGGDRLQQVKVQYQYDRVILVAVKQHDIIRALTPLIPLVKDLQNSCSSLISPLHIILVHNGLRDTHMEKWLDENFILNHNGDGDGDSTEENHPKVVISNMVTSAGAALLTEQEMKAKGLRDTYDRVVRFTGRGDAFIFPRYSNNEDVRTDSFDCIGADTIPLPVGDDNNLCGIHLFSKMIPQCQILSYEDGRCEQILKLAVNVAINGTLAKMALRDWYPYYYTTTTCTKQLSIQHNNDRIQDENDNGTAGEKKMLQSHASTPLSSSLSSSIPMVHRVLNKEMMGQLPLAKQIARLVLKRACQAEPSVKSLQRANDKDEAFRRVEMTLRRVRENCCSTVVDICSNRRTEGLALLSWTQEWSKIQEEEESSIENRESNNESCPGPSLYDASQALEQIYTMLMAWDAKH